MQLEHVAIWTNNLEQIRQFYISHFGAVSNEKYVNPVTLFESYFLSFESGARLEIMFRPGLPENKNDTVAQYLGIIHLAFAVKTNAEVRARKDQLLAAGCTILRGPRITGDGYYEFETLDPDGNRLEVFCVNNEPV